MAFQITAPDGKKYRLNTPDGETPSPEAIQRAKAAILGASQPTSMPALSPQMTEQDKLPSLGERAQVGLLKEPEQQMEAISRLGMQPSQDESGAVMANGNPIAPSFFNDPLGALASQSGNAITMGTQIAGDVAGAPLAAAAGMAGGPMAALGTEMGINAASAGAGDIMRQGLAESQFPGIGMNPGQTGQEALLGAAGPPLGKAAAFVMKPTWRAMSAGMGKLIKATGAGASEALRLLAEVPKELSEYYVNRRLVDKVDILEPSMMTRLTDPAMPENIAKRLLFGLQPQDVIPALSTDNAKLMARQAERLGPGAVDLLASYGKIDPAATQRVLTRGASTVTAPEKLNDTYMLKLVKRVSDGIDTAYREAGKAVREARTALLSGEVVSPSAVTDITPYNTNLATELVNAGMLKRRTFMVDGKEISGYVMTPNVRKATGREQAQTFGNLVHDFFKKTEVTVEPKIKAGTITKEEYAALQADPSLAEAKTYTIWQPKNELPFAKFLAKLNTWERQISTRDFDTLGPMATTLRDYFGSSHGAGLRGKLTSMDRSGMLEQASNAYELLMNSIQPVKNALNSKNPQVIENFFRSGMGSNPTQMSGVYLDAIEQHLKPHGFSFLDDLKDYIAAKEFRKAEHSTAINMANGLKGDLAKVMKPGQENTNQALSLAESKMPKSQHFMQEAKDSAVASAFNRGSSSLIRGLWAGRFLVGTMAGLGALTGNPVGMAAGLGIGVALTSPKYGGKGMLRTATSPGFQKGWQGLANPSGQLPRAAQAATEPGGRVLLSRLLASPAAEATRAKQRKQPE